MKDLEKRIHELKKDYQWWKREGIEQAVKSKETQKPGETYMWLSFLIALVIGVRYPTLGIAFGLIAYAFWNAGSGISRIQEKERMKAATASPTQFLEYLNREKESLSYAASLLEKHALFLSYDLSAVTSYPRKRESKVDWSDVHSLYHRQLLCTDEIKKRVNKKREEHLRRFGYASNA